MNKIKDEIKELFLEKSKLIDSEENKRRLNMWEPGFIPEEYSPGAIGPYASQKRVEKTIPVTAEWERMLWSKLLQFDICQYSTDPLYYLKWTLKVDIFRFKIFRDDTPLIKKIPIWLGVGFEPSFFGVPVIYSSNREPLFQVDGFVLKSKKDISNLKIPDFFKSGLMPLAHKFYEEIGSLIPGDYSVIFPRWSRCPLGVGFSVRGMENLLIDLIKEPKFSHQLLRIITDARIDFSKNRKKYLNASDSDNTLLDDEASIPIISPQLFEEFCLPYESELAKFYGTIKFWHSCGNKTPLIPLIKRISKNIEFMDLNWWNDDILRAVKEINNEIPFQVRPFASDISESNEDIIKNHINGIISTCGNSNFMFRLDCFEPDNPNEDDINKINRYISILRKVSLERI